MNNKQIIPNLSNKAQYYNYFDGVEDKDIIDNCFEQILYLNKGIDELIKKYENYANNIFTNISILNDMTEQNFQKYNKDIVRVWAKYSVYQEFIQDLKNARNGGRKW